MADTGVFTGAQVQATFAGGLAEHLRAAGGATAGVAASLSGAVEQATALAAALGGELADGQRRLQQLAEDAVAAGAHPLQRVIETYREVSREIESYRAGAECSTSGPLVSARGTPRSYTWPLAPVQWARLAA